MLQKKRDKTTEGSDRYGIAGGCSLGSTFSNAFQVGCHQIQILVVCETVQSPCHNPKLSVSSTPSLW